MEWQPIETAPKDGTLIVGWCCHDADPYCATETLLTTYGAQCEGLGHAVDGPHVLEFGYEYSESDYEQPQYSFTIPSWWYVHGTDGEVVANPTHWMPLPPTPTEAKDED